MDNRDNEDFASDRKPIDIAISSTIERDIARVQRDRVAVERDIAENERDYVAVERNIANDQRATAFQSAAVAREEARGSRFGFYLLLGVVAATLFGLAMYSISKSQHPDPGSVIVDREAPVQITAPAVESPIPSSAVTTSAEPAIRAQPEQPAAPAQSVQQPVQSSAPVYSQPSVTSSPPNSNSTTVPQSSPNSVAPDNSTAQPATDSSGNSANSTSSESAQGTANAPANP
jgi:hypothetical protein